MGHQHNVEQNFKYLRGDVSKGRTDFLKML